jgi:hypothetical protein
MADYYVWSGATGAGTGASWADAYTTLAAALTGATGTGPHNILVDSALSETTSAAAANVNAATAGATLAILSVNRGGRTTGTGHDGILKGATFSAPNTFAMNIGTARSQTLHIEGMVLQANSGTSASNVINIANTANTDVAIMLTNCSITSQGSSSGAIISMGPTGVSNAITPSITIRDTLLTTRNNAGGGAISLNNCRVFMIGITHAYAGANKSAQLFTSGTGSRCDVTIQDSDLSGFNSTSGAYVLLTNMQGIIRFVNCKLSGTPGLETGTWPSGAGEIDWINADSGDTRITYRVSKPQGILTHDATYYRTNGAKMWGAGIGWKLVTLARCSEAEPFVSPFIVRALTTAQSTTFGLELMRGNTTLLTNRQAWMRYDRITDALTPLGSMYSSRGEPFITAGANLSSSSETWAGSLANATPQKITHTSTPSELSPIRAQFVYAVASDTVYIDPCVLISGQTDGPSAYWLTDGTVWNSEPAAAGGGGRVIGSSIVLGVI